jgi:hypothetical protein
VLPEAAFNLRNQGKINEKQDDARRCDADLLLRQLRAGVPDASLFVFDVTPPRQCVGAAAYRDGKKMDLTVRIIDGYKRINGQWRSAHEQVSVPVDVLTGKADLTSKP